MDSSLSWSHKFFSKVFGFENLDEQQDTLDETNKSQLTKKKGIKITKLPSSFFSMVLPDTYHQQLQKKWFSIIRMPYQSIQPQQLLQLTYQGISYPNKVLPWLIQNKYKINIKLFNIKRSQYRTCQAFNHYRLQKMNSQLIIIKNKIREPNLAELLGMFLLFREDIQYSDILLRIAQTVEDYLYDAPLMAFSLLYYFCCMGTYLPFLTHQVEEITNIIKQICYNIHQNCSSSSFFQRDKIFLEQYIRIMIQDFWLNLSQPKSGFRQKILYYLIINKMNLKSVSRVCQATIVGLSRILNQGNREKSIQVLRNPGVCLDKQQFLNYLFSSQ